MFNQPTESFGGFFKPAEHNGHLILVTVVHGIGKKFDTLRNQEVDEADVDLVDLDGDQQLREHVSVSHKAITSRLAAGATMILGRIGQVPTKSGFQAWALNAFNEGVDDVRAGAWVNANKPAFVQAAPAPSPQPAPAAPPVNTVTGEVAAGVDLNDPKVQALLSQLNTTPAATAAPATTANDNPPF